jgi:hypothetical protein
MDGSDLALVDVEVVDSAGRRVPTASNLVAFALAGPAEWRGGIAQGDSTGKPRELLPDGVAGLPVAVPAGKDGTTEYPGAARGEDNFILSPKLPVEAGINRVILKAGTTAGTVQLTATAQGLKSASLTIPALALAPRSDGLSADFPERSQRGLLTRGPTPNAPSFRISRTTEIPVEIIAGSAAADARLSTDDNELSRWASDGRPENAWIEYHFAGPVTLNAIDLKLVGWRTRAYPLRITLDGRTVWNGETDRNLGYAHLTFPQASGKLLRIVQTGAVADRDAFGKIVEVNTARQAGDTGADAIGPGWRLGIVEADFYGPVHQ